MFVSLIKSRFGYDDSLDAFGVHGAGGIWGSIATGLWATKTVNPAGADGLFYGNPAQFLIQLKAVAVTAVGVPVMTPVLALRLRPTGRAGVTLYEVTAPPVLVGLFAVIAVPWM